MAAAESSALDIHVHPLVVLSLADHYTREVAQRPSGPRRAIGLLFGQQSGRVVRVLETVEIAFKEDQPGQPLVETEALEDDMQLFSEAYPNYECLGWYSSGSSVTPYDAVLQKQFTKYNERPLFLLMNPAAAAAGGRDLPLTLYEERTHVVQDQTSSEFVKVEYTVQADEAERLTVTYCAKVVNQEEAGSAVISHYTTMIKAVESLKARIRAVHQFLLDVRSGKIDMSREQDQQTLRDIKGLCHRLPVMKQEKFRSDLLAEYNDALLVTYLSSMTKGTQLMAEVQEKFAVVHAGNDREGGGGGGEAGMLGPRGMRSRPGFEDDMYHSARGRRGPGGGGGGGGGFMEMLGFGGMG